MPLRPDVVGDQSGRASSEVLFRTRTWRRRFIGGGLESLRHGFKVVLCLALIDDFHLASLPGLLKALGREVADLSPVALTENENGERETGYVSRQGSLCRSPRPNGSDKRHNERQGQRTECSGAIVDPVEFWERIRERRVRVGNAQPENCDARGRKPESWRDTRRLHSIRLPGRAFTGERQEQHRPDSTTRPKRSGGQCSSAGAG